MTRPLAPRVWMIDRRVTARRVMLSDFDRAFITPNESEPASCRVSLLASLQASTIDRSSDRRAIVERSSGDNLRIVSNDNVCAGQDLRI